MNRGIGGNTVVGPQSQGITHNIGVGTSFVYGVGSLGITGATTSTNPPIVANPSLEWNDPRNSEYLPIA